MSETAQHLLIERCGRIQPSHLYPLQVNLSFSAQQVPPQSSSKCTCDVGATDIYSLAATRQIEKSQSVASDESKLKSCYIFSRDFSNKERRLAAMSGPVFSKLESICRNNNTDNTLPYLSRDNCSLTCCAMHKIYRHASNNRCRRRRSSVDTTNQVPTNQVHDTSSPSPCPLRGFTTPQQLPSSCPLYSAAVPNTCPPQSLSSNPPTVYTPSNTNTSQSYNSNTAGLDYTIPTGRHSGACHTSTVGSPPSSECHHYSHLHHTAPSHTQPSVSGRLASKLTAPFCWSGVELYWSSVLKLLLILLLLPNIAGKLLCLAA